MKRSILISLLLMLIASISTFAQKPYIVENFDINGVKLGSMVSDAILLSKFGTPSRVKTEDDTNITYNYYGKTSIGIYDGKVYDILVRDSKFPVLTDIIEGGIRVGDNAAKVKAKIRQIATGEIIETDKGFLAGTNDVHVRFDVSSRKITAIIYYEAFEPPTFNGGDADDFSKWVNSQLVYPEDARDTNFKGEVLTSFTVNPYGFVTNIKILQRVSPSIDREVMRVLLSAPKWKPGIRNGKPVAVTYTFPIVFRLQNSRRW